MIQNISRQILLVEDSPADAHPAMLVSQRARLH
jgi:hypothetical protein